MNIQQKYHEERSEKGNNSTTVSQDVEHILDLFNLLTVEDKIIVKRMINNKSLF